MSTITLPALPRVHLPREKRQASSGDLRWYDDLWFVATIVISLVASISAFWYAFQNHLILLLVDTHFHLQIARQVFDSVTPGLAQLGGIWLPLPHLLIMPLVWNDYLWHSGLAGSLSSMPFFTIAAIYIFLAARRLTGDSAASFVGSLVFILNPNMLYIQATPLSETLLCAALAASLYYFTIWAQDDTPERLIWAAGAVFLAALSRYDGWALFLAMLVGVIIVGALKRHKFAKIQGNMILFGSLAGLGPVLWILWNLVIFHDPLYFQRSQYSSQAQQSILINAHLDQSYHNFYQAAKTYTAVSLETAGPLLVGLAVLGLLAYLLRERISPNMIAAGLYLVPFVFYIVSLYSGQALIWAPNAAPDAAPSNLYNVRYGSQILAPVAVYVAMLFMRIRFAPLLLIGAIAAQYYFILTGGMIVLQEGQFGASCYRPSPVINYLAQHYDGGRILHDSYTTTLDTSLAGINLSAVIQQGSGTLWFQALQDPGSVVKWVIVRPPLDAVSKNIDVTSDAFVSQFQPVALEPDRNIYLYYKGDPSTLPNRPLPADLVNTYDACVSHGARALSQPSSPPAVQLVAPPVVKTVG